MIWYCILKPIAPKSRKPSPLSVRASCTSRTAAASFSAFSPAMGRAWCRTRLRAGHSA